VSEELRNLARELNVLFVTASQLNRAAVEEIEFDHSHISGGLSKIMTADNVIGIFTSRAMKERGRYQIQFMKTRSSSGVGQKVELEFNLDTLRISDLGEDEDSYSGNNRGSTSGTGSVYQGLKRNSTVVENTEESVSESRDPTQGASIIKSKPKSNAPLIRNMLDNLNPEND
jgi:hypothetical protein